MTPGLRATSRAMACPRDTHVLLVAHDQKVRYLLADVLLDAGFRLTLTSGYGLADLLLQETDAADLLMTVQPVGQVGTVGLAQLARAIRPELPILVLEEETVAGPGVLEAVRHMMRRWPMRDWAAPVLQ